MKNPDQPRYVHPEQNLIPTGDYLQNLMAVPPSRMFLIKKSLAGYLEKYPENETFDASQGDGGASLPGVHPEVLERAAQMQISHGTAYDMPFGTPAFRRSVLENYWQVDSDVGIGPENVLATAGGRDALVKAYTAMLTLGHGRLGDVFLVSRVPWISYNWGPYGLGANVLLAPGREDDGWAYTEEGIRESVAFAARTNRKIAGIVITNPDNPTGRTISAEEQVRLARAALREGVAFVFFDWIYRYVTDKEPINLNEVLRLFSPAERDKVIFLDGITKSLGGSNIRNAHLIAPKRVADFMIARASHTVLPTYFGTAVAQAAYDMGFERATRTIVEPTNASRSLLRAFLTENNFKYILGQGYYAFINIDPWLQAGNFKDSEELGEYLAREYGVAVVPGVYFSAEGAGWIRFSYALPPEVTQAAVSRLHQGLQSILKR